MSDNKLKFQDIRVADGLKFKDISTEEYRTYTYPDMRVDVHFPVALRVSDSGAHYIIAENGVVHYLPAGFRKFTWCVKPGELHVSF